MKETKFGCSYSEVWVSPENWKTTTSKAALSKNWYVQCLFYDPLFKEDYPKGKVYRRKLNKLKTLEERKAAIQFYLEEIPALFETGYNHITGVYMAPEVIPDPEKLSPDTPAVAAIEEVWSRILQASKTDDNDRPFDDVRVAKNRFVKGLIHLRYNNIPIKDLKLSHAKEAIEYLKITDGYYNKFLSYMSKIYTELIEYGCVETNPFKLFKKRQPVKKIREVLNEADFEGVMDYLEENHYNFFRYGMIFHQSGARSTELMRVRVKDVDLKNQEYKVLIKKRNQYTEEIKVIVKSALPLWRELLSESKGKNEFIFSKWLKPGADMVRPRQISRKWHKYIKTRYNNEFDKNITADFYALKHLFLDKLDAMQHALQVENVAQKLASHQTPTITNSVYLVNKKKRERDVLKTISV